MDQNDWNERQITWIAIWWRQELGAMLSHKLFQVESELLKGRPGGSGPQNSRDNESHPHGPYEDKLLVEFFIMQVTKSRKYINNQKLKSLESYH